MHRAAEAALGLAILLLLAILVAPWKAPALPTPALSGSLPSGSTSANSAASPLPALPEAILPIFMGKPSGTSPAPAAAKAPLDASWMQYLGRSTSSDGMTYVFVKDTKTGKLIKAAQEGGTGGWTIVQELTDRLILKNGEVLYSVVKR